MKGLFIALLLVAAIVIGLGFYRGWWSVASDKSGCPAFLADDQLSTSRATRKPVSDNPWRPASWSRTEGVQRDGGSS